MTCIISLEYDNVHNGPVPIIVAHDGKYYSVRLPELAKAERAIVLDDSMLAFVPVDPADCISWAPLPPKIQDDYDRMMKLHAAEAFTYQPLEDTLLMFLYTHYQSATTSVCFGDAAAHVCNQAEQSHGEITIISGYAWDKALAAAWRRLKKQLNQQPATTG